MQGGRVRQGRRCSKTERRLSLEERARGANAARAAANAADACRKCAIGYERRNNVYGEGDPCARLMVVGEGPGRNRRPAGAPVRRARRPAARPHARRDRSCRAKTSTSATPSNAARRCRARTARAIARPSRQEMANCRPFLDEQIEIIRPQVILALGAPAAKSFLGRDFPNHEDARPLVRRPRGIAADGDVSSGLHACARPAAKSKPSNAWYGPTSKPCARSSTSPPASPSAARRPLVEDRMPFQGRSLVRAMTRDPFEHLVARRRFARRVCRASTSSRSTTTLKPYRLAPALSRRDQGAAWRRRRGHDAAEGAARRRWPSAASRSLRSSRSCCSVRTTSRRRRGSSACATATKSKRC